MTMTSNNQYDGQQLRKLWQEAVLPGADISDSPQRLMSLSRACRSVSALLQTGYPEWEGASAATCVRTGHGLFDLMLRKTGQNCPTADKLELISEMYGLLNGISPCPDQSRSRLWDEAAADALEAYFRDRAAMPAAREQTAACLCLLDWFYFMEDVEDEPWMQYLKATVNTWTASFNPEEGWKDTPTETALERIEVLSRNSYMLLDPSHDSTVRAAFLHYSRKAAASPALPCTALGRLFDLATGGDSLPGEQEAARTAASGLSRLESASAPGSDTRLYCTSYRIADLCRSIMARMQDEVFGAIA